MRASQVPRDRYARRRTHAATLRFAIITRHAACDAPYCTIVLLREELRARLRDAHNHEKLQVSGAYRFLQSVPSPPFRVVLTAIGRAASTGAGPPPGLALPMTKGRLNARWFL